jgi:hypothetical protein
MALGTPGLMELEFEVRRRLEEVKLVCELGVSTDDPFFIECHSVLNTYLKVNQIGSLSRDCPAVLVLVLTAIGAKLGTGGQLWEPILEESLDGLRLVGLEYGNTGKFGEQFRHSLSFLNLPDFSHVEGRTNLTPILMHGGIPLHSADVVWRKVQEFVRSGTNGGREIVQELRSDRTQMRYFNQPAQRFIREAGAFAIDMIDRMANVVLSMLEDPESSSEVLGLRHGLPASFIEVVKGSISSERPDSIAVPSPTIYLDLNSGQGPHCNLPRIRERSDEVMWTVCGRNHRASRFDERPVPLEPAASWSVEALVGGRRWRTRVFPSLADGGAWLFADTRRGARLVEPSDGIDEGAYFLIAPRGIRAQVARDVGVATPPLADVGGLGDVWSQHHVLSVNLVGAKSFHLIRSEDGSRIGNVVDVLPGSLRLNLEGDECQGIQEVDGQRVFSGPPTIEFAGEGRIVDGFMLAVRDPKGVWTQCPLASVELTDGKITLKNVINWVTGKYRIEVVGPMGTGGLSETFVVLLDGRLEMEDKLFSPSELVNVSLVFRSTPNDNESSKSISFEKYEYRKYVRSMDNTVLLSLVIPRISFDIGGVGNPPDFGLPSHKTLALEDLNKPRGQRLFIRTGKPSELLVVVRNSNNSPIHTETLTTSGSNASGAIEIDPILESIRLRGVENSVVELVLGEQRQIPMLTIQQVLDFRIRNCDYQIMEDEISGQVVVEVSTETNSPNVRVHVRSLERVWEGPVVGTLSERNEETGNQFAICRPIPPGHYSVELAAGMNTRPIPSTSRLKRFGSIEERTRYLSSIAGDASRLAERIVVGENIPRKELSGCSHDDFSRVMQFIVLRHRDFASNSREFKSAVNCVALEEDSRRICHWITQIGSDVASTRELEVLVIRLFPLFLDNPLSVSVDEDEEDRALANRLWAISPLIGLTFTHRMSSDAVGDYVIGLGSPGAEPNYELLAELTWPNLDERIARARESAPILSEGYALIHFRKVWKQCWTGAGPNQKLLDGLNSLVTRGKELMEATFKGRPYELPQLIASTIPSQLRPGRDVESLAIAKYMHNIYRLAWLATRVETPLETALGACEILGESYGLSKGLIDRALVLAVMTERIGEFRNG